MTWGLPAVPCGSGGPAQAGSGLHDEGRRGHGDQNRQRPAAKIPAHDVGIAAGRAQSRLRRVCRQRPLRVQTFAWSQGIDHVRYDYCFPKWGVDDTHRLFGMDHNRCILCTRCVRVCWHIEGAGTKNVSGRGRNALIITDLKPAVGRSGFLHVVRQMRARLPDRGAFS